MPDFLDDLRTEIHEWTESLWDPEVGGFRQNAEVGANLLSTTDVAWLRYATNDPDFSAGHAAEWISYLQNSQDPETGLISYRSAGQGHSDGHAFWHTVRALKVLGADILRFPEHLRGATTVDGLRAWFDAVDWDGPASNHHEVLGLVPLIVSLEDPALAEAFYERLAEQQNKTTGAWPRPKPNISRTFAYTVLHVAVGAVPPHADRMLDTILSLQDSAGFWGSEPHFHTMDAAYLLVRIPNLIVHRHGDAMRALERLAEALLDFWRQNRHRVMQNPHWALSIVHTFGLLQEAFPERFPSERPFRFDWDLPGMYHCDVIAQAR